MKRVLFLLLVAAALQAQAPSTFREGFLAFENQDWATAEQKMRETIAINPRESEGTVRISGQWFETYVPHYFLARALAKQGKCAEAIKHFEESERQGITPAIPDFARHLRTRGGCKPQEKSTKKEKVIGEVTVPFGGEEVVPATTTTAAPKTTNATTPKTTTTTQPPITVPPPKESYAPLAAAVDAYLRGNYEETARLLANVSFTDKAAAAEAALFRAAAYDALDRMTGGRSDTLRKQVETDLRTYRRLRPNGKPDPRVFPPRFVAMVARF